MTALARRERTPEENERMSIAQRKCLSYKKVPKGSEHFRWAGGRRIQDGYVKVRIDGKEYREHRLIMETHLGRKLAEDELVHHQNRDKADNAVENLAVLSRREHFFEHKEEMFSAPRVVVRGEQHYRSKLTVEQVAAIRNSQKQKADIASEYGMTVQNITAIKTYKTWKHVP